MKTRPIIMSSESVVAIIAGKKSQTRRVINMRDIGFIGSASERDLNDPGDWGFGTATGEWGVLARGLRSGGRHGDSYSIPCPYGVPGDWLWVRESLESFDEPPYEGARYAADKRTVRLVSKGGHMETDAAWTWKRKTLPSILMPRDFSRITLKVTDVRVERVQSISEDDAKAEGVPVGEMIPMTVNGEPAKGMIFHAPMLYAHVWDRINGKRAPWKSNPWVWAVTFERVS